MAIDPNAGQPAPFPPPPPANLPLGVCPTAGHGPRGAALFVRRGLMRWEPCGECRAAEEAKKAGATGGSNVDRDADTTPEAPASSAEPPAVPAPQGSNIPYDANGLSEQARAAADEVNGTFPGIQAIHGVQDRNVAGTDTPSPHATGNALDFMVGAGNVAAGQPIADHLIQNHARMGSRAVIWNGQIWSPRTDWAPRPYTGQDPHTDHVHVEW